MLPSIRSVLDVVVGGVAPLAQPILAQKRAMEFESHPIFHNTLGERKVLNVTGDILAQKEGRLQLHAPIGAGQSVQRKENFNFGEGKLEPSSYDTYLGSAMQAAPGFEGPQTEKDLSSSSTPASSEFSGTYSRALLKQSPSTIPTSDIRPSSDCAPPSQLSSVIPAGPQRKRQRDESKQDKAINPKRRTLKTCQHNDKGVCKACKEFMKRMDENARHLSSLGQHHTICMHGSLRYLCYQCMPPMFGERDHLARFGNQFPHAPAPPQMFSPPPSSFSAFLERSRFAANGYASHGHQMNADMFGNARRDQMNPPPPSDLLPQGASTNGFSLMHPPLQMDITLCEHNCDVAACKECRFASRCFHGKVKNYCKECRSSVVCIHDIKKVDCKECKGTKICVHDRVKYLCKECKGSQICVHDKVKTRCKECDGSAICTHGRVKYRCKECKGCAICVHGRVKTRCKECKGSDFCIHDNKKSYCKECKGSAICVHDKLKFYCRECKGSAICAHGRVKYRCKDCKGSEICAHGRVKYRCKECKGSEICAHGKLKYSCKECKGSAVCVHDRLKYGCKKCKEDSTSSTKPDSGGGRRESSIQTSTAAADFDPDSESSSSPSPDVAEQDHPAPDRPGSGSPRQEGPEPVAADWANAPTAEAAAVAVATRGGKRGRAAAGGAAAAAAPSEPSRRTSGRVRIRKAACDGGGGRGGYEPSRVSRAAQNKPRRGRGAAAAAAAAEVVVATVAAAAEEEGEGERQEADGREECRGDSKGRAGVKAEVPDDALRLLAILACTGHDLLLQV